MTTLRSRSRSTWPAMLMSMLLVACGGGDGGGGLTDPDPVDVPQPGSLSARLTTPNADDQAIQFRVTAGGGVSISSVAAACSGCRLFARTVSGTEVRGVVVGSLTSGASVLRMSVSDVRNPAAYTVSVIAAANGDFDVRNGTGYSLTVGS